MSANHQTALFVALCVIAVRGTLDFSLQHQTCTADVLVLGAGMAGVKAGADLAASGLHTLVLEQASDVGGRMKAVSFGKETIELGANWIEGIPQSENPIWAIAQEIGLRGNYTEQEDSRIKPTLYDVNGAVPLEVADAVHKKLSKGLLGALEVSCDLHRGGLKDISLRTALTQAGWPAPAQQTPLERTLEFFVVDWDFEFPPEEVSTFNFFSVGHANAWKETCNGSVISSRPRGFRARTAARLSGILGGFSWESPRFFVTDPRGYAAVARHVAGALLGNWTGHMMESDRPPMSCPPEGQSAILTSKNVTSIRYGGSNGTSCKVFTADGASYTAQYCISTFSSGVVLANAAAEGGGIFNPPLPAWKRAAYRSAVNGIYTKIFLEFRYNFWADADYVLFAHPERRGSFAVWQDLESHGKFFPSGAHLLMVTVVQAQSRQVESQPKDKTVAEIMKVLRQMYGDSVPNEGPLRTYVPRWQADPAFRGCWSNMALGGGDFRGMQRALGSLHFAGEATDPEFNGFTLGGFTSGQRAAAAVLRLFADSSEFR